MKLGIKIAAAKRRLRRMEEDRPLFLKRIEDYSETQKIFAVKFFETTLEQMKSELGQLISENEKSSAQ